ncbi:glycoside hydrolase family 99-like domain-containing protein [Mucilaginibacter sp. SG564]|uniref:glycoside hydrolase family 99-like domain-containing protein n=1 Tax=unclassified Mucilaginibacter TaxID=2617802 RepID=UPI00155712A5|nr:glycoside hydrolase family 99-like domain-containing protein [Mucilaginibacter sp. SG564]NOW93638.1 hypothetical protein [Mucilaginibacter sp. SG564]
MKKRHIYRYSLLLLLISAGLFSCKKNDPSVKDNFLNYQIPDVPVTSNYTVGAFYYTFTTLNANVTQIPTVGKYGYTNGLPPAGIMQQHIADAGIAKIDYFIFSVRSPTLDNKNYLVDSTTVNAFLTAPNSAGINFALSYNLNTGLLGITNSGGTTGNGVTIETDPVKLAAFYNDFKRLAFFLGKTNYQKVNGKYLLIINNAQDLNSKDNVALYKQLRVNLSILGFDLYIVGMQNRWSPPERYYYRFQNCTDAMYEANMGDVAGDNDRYWNFPQYTDQNWAYWKKTIEAWNMEFVPCVMGGYNYQINNPTTNQLSVQRTADGSWYKTFTNVAKRNASKSRLIFVDSFNNFSVDSQIEPTQAYGNTYLDITRKAFKLN